MSNQIHWLYAISNRYTFKESFDIRTYPKDCSEIPKGSPSGPQILYPQGTFSSYFIAFCDMSSDGGGWTVIQRNRYGSANIWDQTWQMYKSGFGSVAAEHWLGNENIYQLTSQKMYKVRFVIYDPSNNLRLANYDYFAVDSESLGYALRLGRYSGTAGDALMTYSSSLMQDNMKFSTRDRDQDFSSTNCASTNGGGWWYNSCRYGQLNSYNNIYWYGFCHGNCKGSEILIKPVNA
ncbi:fibrinogen-like protein 1-like protein [Protopterus annectens]|uniref:fibrinogen-like protein 1-like protein n=1 Tax=Protopterus annectens TaxID=7888 RepID=UPI001CFB9706|nr:fibrinogen-like protein 1-like protein [Protopterus annectens]